MFLTCGVVWTSPPFPSMTCFLTSSQEQVIVWAPSLFNIIIFMYLSRRGLWISYLYISSLPGGKCHTVSPPLYITVSVSSLTSDAQTWPVCSKQSFWT